MRFLQVATKILYPHEWFSVLFNHHNDMFMKVLVGDSFDNIPKFWHEVEEMPAYKTHSVRSQEGHRAKVVPLALHGDGVPVIGVAKAGSQSANIWSVTSLLTYGPTNFFYHMIYMMWKDSAETETHERVWLALGWSFYWLQRGVWPRCDMDRRPYHPDSPEGRKAGTPLAGGYGACLLLLLGDLDYVAADLRLEHYGSRTPCCVCQANKSTIPWTHCHPRDAAWWPTVWQSVDAWRASHPNACKIFEILSISAMNYFPDLMHVKHLGSDHYVYASVISLLVHEIMPGQAAANWSELWTCIRAHASQAVAAAVFARLSRVCCHMVPQSYITWRCHIDGNDTLRPATLSYDTIGPFCHKACPPKQKISRDAGRQRALTEQGDAQHVDERGRPFPHAQDKSGRNEAPCAPVAGCLDGLLRQRRCSPQGGDEGS